MRSEKKGQERKGTLEGGGKAQKGREKLGGARLEGGQRASAQAQAQAKGARGEQDRRNGGTEGRREGGALSFQGAQGKRLANRRLRWAGSPSCE